MGFWDFFGSSKGHEIRISAPVAAGKTPRIRSVEDLLLQIQQLTEDADISKLVFGACWKVGFDGVIEIRKGGKGNPYQVEYVRSEPKTKALRRELEQWEREVWAILRSDSPFSEDDLERYGKELSRLSPRRVIIWVSCESNKEFKLKKDMFVAAAEAMESVLGGHGDSGGAS